MSKAFSSLLHRLTAIANQFDEERQGEKLELLRACSAHSIPAPKLLMRYADVLLFLVSHPGNGALQKLAEKEMARLTRHLKQHGLKATYENSGLPYSTTLSRFSYDIIDWMLHSGDVQLRFDSFTEESQDLNEVLKLSLPSLEREHTSAGYTYQELLEALQVKAGQEVAFLIEQLSKFTSQPLLKDYLFDSLDLYIRVSSSKKTFSKFYNTLSCPELYYHQDLLKRFDTVELINRPLPEAEEYTVSERESVLTCIKHSLVLTARETDPATFCDPDSLKVFRLERGISVAIYGMTANRQLPFESYVGYTLFKNGFPAAYGGCWITGARSLFGINIFEPYRGGESGFMMMQILRVYRQVFGITYFEVEPYQFGKDNPDGITSGAYWFYYRLGFRSTDKKLKALAEQEMQKIKTRKEYRSSYKTLESFTDSYIALELDKKVPPPMSYFTSRITSMIRKEYKGNRQLAEDKCMMAFLHEVKGLRLNSAPEIQVLKEMALIAKALGIKDRQLLHLLGDMVTAKTVDVYAYQKIQKRFCNHFVTKSF